MKFREDSTKGEMMYEQRIRSEAWLEGAKAVYHQHGSGGDVHNRPTNPYALVPKLEYTPSVLYISGLYASAGVAEGKTLQEAYQEFYDWLADVKQEAYDAGVASASL
jgi:hypothetical protein